MSCNGCRVLRKGCNDACILRSCLQWIGSSESQGHATLFVAKFFGRAGLMSFISDVPESHRPALFQSLLFEACGRTVNPVNGAVGLMGSGNWQVCQEAVETVLQGGKLHPLLDVGRSSSSPDKSETSEVAFWPKSDILVKRKRNEESADLSLSLRVSSLAPGSPSSMESGTTTNKGSRGNRQRRKVMDEEVKLLDLFC